MALPWNILQPLVFKGGLGSRGDQVSFDGRARITDSDHTTKPIGEESKLRLRRDGSSFRGGEDTGRGSVC